MFFCEVTKSVMSNSSLPLSVSLSLPIFSTSGSALTSIGSDAASAVGVSVPSSVGGGGGGVVPASAAAGSAGGVSASCSKIYLLIFLYLSSSSIN
jgi:hypothetical protein